ncbi:Hypothetical protein SRAE_0000071450 [Strongyloides ratti]|uniref:Ribonuclease H-like domain-containing protein n=1 Tax=Strongyloides ratti TaxID=34506 RepID=A0A090L0D6_STRRB|nr:Hypothetical protein SRAE_0000071450 [Strongyloides ratti]CEF61597.1 Hypothetical protein SRAE_0000071450 [Strongyloides ratti]
MIQATIKKGNSMHWNVIYCYAIERKNTIDSSEQCKLKNIGRHKTVSNKTTSIPDSLLEVIAINLICQKISDTSGKKYKYILVNVDNCTRFTIQKINKSTPGNSNLLVKHAIKTVNKIISNHIAQNPLLSWKNSLSLVTYVMNNNKIAEED